MKLNQLLSSTTLLNQHYCNKTSAWCYLGFIKNLSSFQSAGKCMSLSAEEKCHCSQKLFNAVLQSYLQVNLMHKGIQDVLLKLVSNCKDQVLLLNQTKINFACVYDSNRISTYKFCM